MWQNMQLYWAWCNSGQLYHPSPTKKYLKYVEIQYSSLSFSICCGVFDDGIYTKLNEKEIEWHKNHGANIITQGT